MSILKSKLEDESGFEHRASHWRGQSEEIHDQEETLRLGGGLEAQERHRARGKMTARERVT
ncbi:MAG: hypothetical protein WBG64_14950, partial [Thermoanaerobaculia bacterium]